jgi:hypothetical protein
MPTPLPVSFSWQLLPASPTMKHVRRTGRGLKRWGTRKGIKPGTSSADQARIMAARWIHIYTTPHTQRPDVHFDNAFGETFEVESDPNIPFLSPSPTAIFNPYTLANLATQCENAFQKLADTTEGQSYYRPETVSAMNGVMMLTGTGQGSFASAISYCLSLYRAIVTIRDTFTPTGDAEDDYFFCVDTFIGSRDYLSPIKGSAEKIRYQPPSAGGDLGAWSGLDFAEKWLC